MIADFRDFLSALNRADVRFLVVGAHALAAHGVPRVTGDLDVWVEPTADNAGRVSKAMAAFGAPLTELGIDSGDFLRIDQVVQLGLPPYRIDILTSISGVTFADAWRERLAGTLFKVPVCFLGRESFITNKRATGREKDLRDIQSITG